ncbi:Abi family protein [Nocardia takedensis]|uniref:Abi family protein n=1 Tax=Nocardia takedensis TaxID=259390 RepID=UPI0002E22AE6|nr:Abi family protein [Nocardia takedensis]
MSTPLKPFLSIDDQVALLAVRGMTIEPTDEAKRWLSAVGYYRLSGYSYPFRAKDPTTPAKRLDTFVLGTSFREVVALYEFDRHLKTLILSGLERVEVALRSQTGHTLGGHDPLSYNDATLFRPEFCTPAAGEKLSNHDKWLDLAKRRVKRAADSNDQAVVHHINNYGGMIPIWVLTDVLDFADLSKLFAGLTAPNQAQIMDWFGIRRPAPDPAQSKSSRVRDHKRWNRNPPLASWLLHLSIVRNICAHHGRLWNRQLTPVGTPTLKHLPGFDGLPPDQFESVYGTICLITFLLNTTSPGHTWTRKIAHLVQNTFADFTIRQEIEMGFPAGWQELPLWKAALAS